MKDIANAISRSRLYLIINPTEQCNLRCSYCYESFQLREMSVPVQNGVVNLIRRRAALGLKLLELEFFGGEPLAAWSVVSRIGQDASDACRKSGTALFGHMTTNGTLLTSDRLRFLVECGITWFQITLDGPPEIHDERRIRANGQGSFNSVQNAIRMIKADSDAAVTLRIHHDPTILERLIGSGFVQGLVQEFLIDNPRFQLHFHPVSRWGGPNDSTLTTYETFRVADDATGRLAQAAVNAGASELQVPQLRVSDHVGETGLEICYAARANAFLIRSDGRIGKCTVALDDERNTVGHVEENGDLMIDHERHLPWLRGLLSGEASQLSCPAQHVVWQ